MSFRETREMLLLAYDGKVISDEEFLVLWESCRSKNPDFPHSSYARFDLENIDETECLAEFRVQKQDIPVLANVLQLPMNIHCQQRTICDRIEGLCMLLRRFSYPCRYSDMISRFGRPAYIETAPLSFLGLTLLPYRTTSNKSNALNEFISVKVNIHI